MSDTAIIILIGLGLLAAAFLIYRKIEAVHLATNSMKDALVASTKLASFLEGEKSQRALDAQRELQRHIDEKAQEELKQPRLAKCPNVTTTK
jgi:hypothetical protein